MARQIRLNCQKGTYRSGHFKGMKRTQAVILGAGPAGCAIANLLARRSFAVTVVERGFQPGGAAGSFEFGGLRVDYGSHRLHPSCPPNVLEDIRSFLGAKLLDRPRHGRIRLSGRWLHFPLKPLDLARNLPAPFLFGLGMDAATKFARRGEGDTYAAVLHRRLGPTICRYFYYPYARKIWGAAPEELDGEQARRRVSAGSVSAIIKKILKAGRPGSAGGARFYYPANGFGSISEAYYCAARKAGAQFLFGTAAAGIDFASGRAAGVIVEEPEGRRRLESDVVVSTIPVTALARAVNSQVPAQVVESAGALRFRAMILIYLLLDTEQFTEYDAHYFPDSGIPITRVSEPKNYGLQQAPGRTVLCAELPCSKDDPVWTAPDEELSRLAVDSLNKAGLMVRCAVRQAAVRRLPQAYPVYARGYREHFERLDGWASELDGLITIGRQGLFAHDNTHHTLAMAYALNESLSDEGRLNRELWERHRSAFRTHVVED